MNPRQVRTRRQCLRWALAGALQGDTTFALAEAASDVSAPSAAPQPNAARPWLGDMHSHAAMFRPSLNLNLREEMEQAGISLVGWALVDDSPFTRATPQGIKQVRQPAPGSLWAYFQERVQRYDAQLARWRLSKVLSRADLDRALAGEPMVVMASESANFLEGQPERVALAHAMGLRHLQLVHFIDSPLGDLQTEAPRHQGMAKVTVEVLQACRKNGVLVDLAHASPAFVDAALDASDAVMVWTHSWISRNGGSWRDWPNVARSLSPAQARKIVARGGVVGLWTVRVKSDRNYQVSDARSYADEIMRMVDLVGEKGVAFGTDLEGAGADAVMMRYADLREVADTLARKGMPPSVLQDVCIGNYARVLKHAMSA